MPTNFDGLQNFGGTPSGTVVTKGENLFNRIDIQKELKELEKIAQELASKNQPKAEAKQDEELVDIADFAKIKLCTAKVLSCEKVAKSDKLLVFKLQVGDEVRQVVSGIAQHYSPDYMIGKTVVLVKNLKPAKIRGVESNGMILCASDDKSVVFVTPEKDMDSGKEVR